MSPPLPIAELLRRARNAKSPKERHDSAYFGWEASIRLAVSARPPRDASALAMASIGHWAAAAQVGDLALAAPALLTVYRLFCEVGQGRASTPATVGARALLDALPAYRNQVMGHGSLRASSFYDEAAAKLIDGLSAAWEQGVFWAQGARMVYVDTIEIAEGGERRARVLDLSGEAAQAERSPETVPDHVLPRRVYLREVGQLSPVHPWLLFREDGLRERVLFFNGRHRSGAHYLDYVSGESLRGKELSEASPGIEEALLRLFEGSAPPPTLNASLPAGGVATGRPSARARRLGPAAKRWAAAAALVLVLVAGVVGAKLARRKPGNPARAKTLVVLPFENVANTREYEWLGDGVAGALMDRLRQSKKLRLVNAPDVERVSAAEAGRLAGARWVISGRFVVAGEDAKLTATISSTETGKTVKTVERTGKTSGLLPLEEALTSAVLADLPKEIELEEVLLDARAETASEDAFASYSKAVTVRRRDRGWNAANATLGKALLEEALRRDPGFVGARLLLGGLLEHLYQLTGETQYLEQAQEQANEVLRTQPNNTWALLGLCNVNLRMGKAKEAMAFCDAAARNTAEASDHLDIAVAYWAVGNLDEATRILERMVKEEPNVSWLHMNLAEVLRDDHRLPEAEAAARIAAHLQDEDLRLGDAGPTVKAGWFETMGAHSALGAVLAAQGKHGEAAQEFRKEIDQARGRTHLYKERSLIESWAGLLEVAYAQRDGAGRDQAVAALVKLAEASPKSRNLNGVAWVLATSGSPDQATLGHALRLAERAVEVTSRKDPKVLDTLAEVKERLGDRAASLELAKEALLVSPRHPESLRRVERLGGSTSPAAKAAVTQAVRAVLPAVRQCYEAELRDNPGSRAASWCESSSGTRAASRTSPRWKTRLARRGWGPAC
ncbi:MAG: hypothetical protein QM765_37520 [Myxococcales bacterium]